MRKDGRAGLVGAVLYKKILPRCIVTETNSERGTMNHTIGHFLALDVDTISQDLFLLRYRAIHASQTLSRGSIAHEREPLARPVYIVIRHD